MQRLLEVRGRERLDVVRVPGEPDACVGERQADVVAPDLEEPGEPGAFEDRPVRLERVAEAPRREETTSPLIRNARTTVMSGARMPPALWRSP